VNRLNYFNYIEEKLNLLATRIKKRGKLNLLELNIHSENFYCELLNMIFGFSLANRNYEKRNIEGIDLIDKTNRIVVQVSATCSKQKIEQSLKKETLTSYEGYRFIFVLISGDASILKKKTYLNPHNISFEPKADIIDLTDILNKIFCKSITELRRLYELIKGELGEEIDVVKMDSILAGIIDILSREPLANSIGKPEVDTFEIMRKIEYNNLVNTKMIINDYKIYYHKINQKYKEFDKQGANKSMSVFQTIKKQYSIEMDECKDEDEIFLKVINNIMTIVITSKNYVEITFEELEMYTGILVVDAFIRCKIFENPEGYNYVIT